MSWLSEHHDLLNLLVNFLLLVVWGSYLQLFWRGYRRQIQANVVISRGTGPGLAARCLVSNMSAEAIVIEGIIATVTTAEGQRSHAVSEYGNIADGDASAAHVRKFEGPLKAAEHVDVGDFRSLCREALARSEDDLDLAEAGLRALEIWVIADYSTENRLVFARRRFIVEQTDGHLRLRPDQLETEIVRSRGKRREIERILQEHLEGLDGRVPNGARV